eukprot:UN00067
MLVICIILICLEKIEKEIHSFIDKLFKNLIN